MFLFPSFCVAGALDDPIDLMAPRLPIRQKSPSPVAVPTPVGGAAPASNSRPAAASSPSSASLLPYDHLSRDNIHVTAHTLETGSVNYTYWATSWGSYSKDFTQKKLVEVSLSAIGNSGQPVSLEFFRVFRIDGGSEVFVKSEAQDMMTNGSGAWCVAMSATRNVTHYRMAGVTTQSGEKIVGWFVRAIRSHRIVGFASSPSTYDRFAENPASPP